MMLESKVNYTQSFRSISSGDWDGAKLQYMINLLHGRMHPGDVEGKKYNHFIPNQLKRRGKLIDMDLLDLDDLLHNNQILDMNDISTYVFSKVNGFKRLTSYIAIKKYSQKVPFINWR